MTLFTTVALFIHYWWNSPLAQIVMLFSMQMFVDSHFVLLLLCLCVRVCVCVGACVCVGGGVCVGVIEDLRVSAGGADGT